MVFYVSLNLFYTKVGQITKDGTYCKYDLHEGYYINIVL